MLKFEKLTYDLSLKLNNYIDSKVKKYAMFDLDFTDEFNYYSSKEAISGEIINNYNYVIFDGNNIIGYITLNIFVDEVNDTGCNINPIIVFEQYRNRGYAFEIVTFLKEKVFKENIKYFECAVDKNNIESYRLFQKSKFETFKEENNYIYMRWNKAVTNM